MKRSTPSVLALIAVLAGGTIAPGAAPDAGARKTGVALEFIARWVE